VPKKSDNPQVTKEEEVVVDPIVTRELTRAELFYIDSHSDSVHADEIAADLGVDVEQVKERLEAVKNNTAKKDPTMFERTLGKKKHGTGGAVIMTEGASQQVDNIHENKLNPARMPGYVFKPRG
jgi:hypothetical protein